MENASKALAIAGGMLIALLIIGTLVFMFQRISDYRRQEQNEERLQQVIEFNKEYEIEALCYQRRHWNDGKRTGQTDFIPQ